MRKNLAILAVALVVSAAPALAQQKAAAASASATLSNQLVGTWNFHSTFDQLADGSKRNAWNANAKGILMFDAKGHYSSMVIDADRPKSGALPTVPVGKMVAHFGTYSVNNSDHTLVFHIERNSSPEGEGVNRSAKLILTGDTLEIVQGPVPSPTGPFYAHTTWVKAK